MRLSNPWMSGPVTCDTVCAAQMLSCVVVPNFPALDFAEPAAGVAAYGTDGDNENAPLSTCGETPAATLNGKMFAGMFCMCR